MNKIWLFLAFLPFVARGQEPFRLLEPSDFETELRKAPEAKLLDMRNVDSYTLGHIRKAQVIDFMRDDLKEYLPTKYKKTDLLFIYAQSESNTLHAGQYFSELGYSNVVVLKGGFENWIRKSKPYKSNNGNFKPLSYISKENYYQIIKEKKWVLVMFHDEICSECEKMEDTLKQIESENADFKVAKVDLQINSGIAEWQDIRKSPTLVLYKNGIQYWKTTGYPDKAKIKSQIF